MHFPFLLLYHFIIFDSSFRSGAFLSGFEKGSLPGLFFNFFMLCRPFFPFLSMSTVKLYSVATKAQCSVILYAHISFTAVKFHILCKLPSFSDPVSIPDLLIFLSGNSPGSNSLQSHLQVAALPSFCDCTMLLEKKVHRSIALIWQ